MKEKMNTEIVEIEIMDKQFSISTPIEEKKTLLETVSIFNQKIDMIRNQNKITDSDKIIILSALNLLQEFIKKIKSLEEEYLNISEIEDRIDLIVEQCKGFI